MYPFILNIATVPFLQATSIHPGFLFSLVPVAYITTPSVSFGIKQIQASMNASSKSFGKTFFAAARAGLHVVLCTCTYTLLDAASWTSKHRLKQKTCHLRTWTFMMQASHYYICKDKPGTRGGSSSSSSSNSSSTSRNRITARQAPKGQHPSSPEQEAKDEQGREAEKHPYLKSSHSI